MRKPLLPAAWVTPVDLRLNPESCGTSSAQPELQRGLQAAVQLQRVHWSVASDQMDEALLSQ